MNAGIFILQLQVNKYACEFISDTLVMESFSLNNIRKFNE